jgi:hypothetical protein
MNEKNFGSYECVSPASIEAEPIFMSLLQAFSVCNKDLEQNLRELENVMSHIRGQIPEDPNKEEVGKLEVGQFGLMKGYLETYNVLNCKFKLMITELQKYF